MFYQSKPMIYQLCTKPLNFTQIRIVKRITLSTVYLNKPLHLASIYIEYLASSITSQTIVVRYSRESYSPRKYIHTGITTMCSTTHKPNISTTVFGFPLSPCIHVLSRNGSTVVKFCCAVFYIEVLMLLRWSFTHPISTTANYLFLLYILATPRPEKYFFHYLSTKTKGDIYFYMPPVV